MRTLLALSVLALCACSPQAPDGSKAPPPEDFGGAATAADDRRQAALVATSDFSKPMVARGNEPFWAVKMDGTRFTYSRPGQPDTLFEAPGAQIVPGKAVWVAKAADGRQMTLTLYMSDCSDGMSDLRYPMAAEVELLGETLGGCAAKASELPKPRPAG
jgi:uncharacterized membrane protein